MSAGRKRCSVLGYESIYTTRHPGIYTQAGIEHGKIAICFPMQKLYVPGVVRLVDRAVSFT